MGNLLRRYWHPVAGISEFDSRATKALRILGEDLVVFRDGGSHVGLLERRCSHRNTSLEYGFIQERGIRCPRSSSERESARAPVDRNQHLFPRLARDLR